MNDSKKSPLFKPGKQLTYALCFLVLLLLSSTLYRSRSASAQGKPLNNWTSPVDLSGSSNLQANGPEPVCDSQQNLHLFWHDTAENGTSAIYYASRSERGWSVPLDIIFTPYVIGNRSLRATADRERIHLLWTSHYDHRLFYSNAPLSSLADAHEWREPVEIARNVALADVLIAESQSIYIFYGSEAYDDPNDLSTEVGFVKSSDGGETWSPPQEVMSDTSPVPVNAVPNAAIDGRGRIHLGVTVRSVEYGQYSQAYYLRSTDAGESWQELKSFTPSVTFPGLAHLSPFAFGEDEVHLTWHNPERLHMWSNDGGDTWSGPVLIREAGAAFGGQNQLAKDSGGNMFAVTASASGVFVSKWIQGQWGEQQTVDSREIDPHHQRLVVCEGNKLHVLYDGRLQQGIWYSGSQTGSPPIVNSGSLDPTDSSKSEQPQDAAEQSPASSTNTDEPSNRVLSVTEKRDLASGPTDATASLLVSILPALLLVVAVLLVYFLQNPLSRP